MNILIKLLKLTLKIAVCIIGILFDAIMGALDTKQKEKYHREGGWYVDEQTGEYTARPDLGSEKKRGW
jgi:hypothetical protein